MSGYAIKSFSKDNENKMLEVDDDARDNWEYSEGFLVMRFIVA